VKASIKWTGFGLIGVLSLVLAVALLPWRFSTPDPVYQGKRLSQHLAGFRGDAVWIDDSPPFGLRVYSVSRPALSQTANAALAEAGTNAIPLLLDWLTTKDSTRDWIVAAARILAISNPDHLSAVEKRSAAVVALHRLGPLAGDHLREILPLLGDPYHVHVAVLAAAGVGAKQGPALLTLTNACNNGYFVTEMNALTALGSMGWDATPAMPTLISKLLAPSHEVRAAATVACAKVSGSAEVVVPLIVANLQSTNRVLNGSLAAAQVDQMNLWALGQFGPAARSALPVISNLVSSPDATIRQAAADAIEKIGSGQLPPGSLKP